MIDQILESLYNREIKPLEAKEQLIQLFDTGSIFTKVYEQEPPHQVELLVKSPDGLIHLANWRPAYNIFTCQAKGESSFDWSWKLI